MAALDGLRVLDMTQYEAGTSCTQALAWHGADVVKIEQPGVGDPGRRVNSDGEFDSHYFINWNSNKRSVTINLRTERGRELLFEMLPRYDVFVENYGPGVMERLGLDYDSLKAVHPSIIYARLKGFGLSGPFAGYKSFDVVAQNAAGSFSMTGEADGPPMRPGPCVGDSGTGMQLAFAIATAYIQKLRTGEGQHIEISMQEAMTYYVRSAVAETRSWGDVTASRRGNRGNGPTDLYPCKPLPGSDGSNDYIYLIALTTRMWDTFCAAMNRPDMVVDPRFVDEQDRIEHARELRDEIRKFTIQHDKWEAMQILGEAGVPCSATHSTYDLFHNPHFDERNFIQDIDHPEWGPIRLLGWAPKMSKSNVPMTAAPLLAEHTREVLCDDLGIEGEEFARLEAEGIVSSRNGA